MPVSVKDILGEFSSPDVSSASSTSSELSFRGRVGRDFALDGVSAVLLDPPLGKCKWESEVFVVDTLVLSSKK